MLHHAAEEEIFGLGMLGEPNRQGYRISPGTLYPLLHRLTHRGALKAREVRGRTRRRLYRATSNGRKALVVVVHARVRELIGDLDQNPRHVSRRRPR